MHVTCLELLKLLVKAVEGKRAKSHCLFRWWHCGCTRKRRAASESVLIRNDLECAGCVVEIEKVSGILHKRLIDLGLLSTCLSNLPTIVQVNFKKLKNLN